MTIIYILSAFLYGGIGVGFVIAFDDDPRPSSLIVVLLWPLVLIGAPVAYILKKLSGAA